MTKKGKVLIINSNVELIEAIADWLEGNGFEASSVHVVDIKRNRRLYKDSINKFKPDLIIYDIAIPYDENWEFFKVLYASKHSQGIKFVLTTTNKTALNLLVKEKTPAYEIVGKPFDLDKLARSIKKIVEEKKGTEGLAVLN